ncbi:MAG: hypothetical protein NTW21_12355 [Verrucomicrobia bacterium]|nr:hypothetical protein [Verrucomicrobiota bacterium]
MASGLPSLIGSAHLQWVDQLKEGGRMLIPAGPLMEQVLYVLVKQDGKVRQRTVLPVRLVPMTGQVKDR